MGMSFVPVLTVHVDQLAMSTFTCHASDTLCSCSRTCQPAVPYLLVSIGLNLTLCLHFLLKQSLPLSAVTQF